jgi:CDP-4-dehydro-6-deoxyglucose reductase
MGHRLARSATGGRATRCAAAARARGEHQLADGLVSTESLLRLYPQAEFEASGLLERVVQIRDESFGRRLRERLLPSQEVLAQRLFRQSQELADVQRHLQRYHALVLALRGQLQALAAVDPDPRLLDLQGQLNDGLARALATEPVDVLDVMDDMLKVVSAQVTLRPSGHQFSVEGHDTLLQSGMRAGLKLNYGCGNGSCGMCKVRVTAGQVVRTMPTDYPLSEQEKGQGYVLACAHTAASSELTLETLEAAGPADIPTQQIVTTVRACARWRPTPCCCTCRHRAATACASWPASRSRWLPPAQGENVHAQHPIASCPCDDRNLQFFIPRDEHDPLACSLFAGAVKPGDALSVRGPVGRFVLADSPHPLVFAACDTGFAPIKSLIEHALSLDAAPSITLFWLATRPDGHFMANQCRAWSEALDPFEYSLSTHSDVATGASQMATAIRADLFDIDCAFYIAGPAAFVQTLRADLAAAGVPASQLHGEVLA